MDRRELMAAIAAIGLAPAARALAAEGDLAGAARDAWIYGLPVIEMGRTRALALSAGARTNILNHRRVLAGPENRGVTAPNNDTLYSNAFIDLTRGPLTLELPPTGRRYFSACGVNMFTDNDFILGTRTTGGEGGRFTIVGPGQAGDGPGVARLSTPHGALLIRTVVDGPEDLPKVHAIQDAIRLSGPAGGAAFPKVANRNAPWAEYFASLASLLAQDPPPPTDLALFRRCASLGLTASGGFDPKRFDADAARQIEAGLGQARALLRSRGGAAQPIQGWRYPPADLGFYGQDYLTRAAVALGGLFAMTTAEAMYMNPVGDDGRTRMFTGPGPYRLSFAAGQTPPVEGFWSLTMYQATPEGQTFLAPNPQKRYSIGDRTPGLRRGPDGSLDLWIARSDPGGERTANWLPAPASGPFTLSMRCYYPKPALSDGRYRLPPVRPA